MIISAPIFEAYLKCPSKCRLLYLDKEGDANIYSDFIRNQNNAYRHNRTGEDNGDAHLKRQIMGREVVVAVTGGKLDFGPWEQIFYGEFDGRRKKRALVKTIGE
jgi:secondary thiamine-phosphate synthase enzyme